MFLSEGPLKIDLLKGRGGAEGYSRYSLNTYFFAKKFLYFSDPRKWVFQQENLSPGDAGFDEKTLLWCREWCTDYIYHPFCLKESG